MLQIYLSESKFYFQILLRSNRETNNRVQRNTKYLTNKSQSFFGIPKKQRSQHQFSTAVIELQQMKQVTLNIDLEDDGR